MGYWAFFNEIACFGHFWSILVLKHGFNGLEMVSMCPVTMRRHLKTCVNTKKTISGSLIAPQVRKVMFPITVRYFWISTQRRFHAATPPPPPKYPSKSYCDQKPRRLPRFCKKKLTKMKTYSRKYEKMKTWPLIIFPQLLTCPIRFIYPSSTAYNFFLSDFRLQVLFRFLICVKFANE